MITEKELFKKAVAELITIFGKEYLQDNYQNTCKACGFVNDNYYQLFLGIKGAKDLPDRKVNDKGWVVYGLVWINGETGEVVKLEYALE